MELKGETRKARMVKNFAKARQVGAFPAYVEPMIKIVESEIAKARLT